MVLLMGIGLVFSVGAIAPPPSGQAPGGSFQGLGFLSTLGFLSHAWDVSADGTTVTGYSHVGDWSKTFYWTQTTGMVALPLLPGVEQTSYGGDGISFDGLRIAGSCGWDGWAEIGGIGAEACVWTNDGTGWTVTGLGDLASGQQNSHGYAMTPDGTMIVGDASSAKGTEACRWTLENGTWVLQGLGDLPKGEYFSQAYGVSADGKVLVGQGSIANGSRAFRWTAAKGMVNLGTVGKQRYSSAWGCSADGNVVVGESFNNRGRDEIAFQWTSSTGMVGLGDLPGGSYYSEADGVSPDGNIVVGGSMTSVGVEAFIWDATNGMRRLVDVFTASGVSVPSGWTLQYANGITVNAGVITIVGTGINPDGYTEAWRAVIGQ
jgi:probable HAF family extracellular repeat protein